MFPLRKNCFKTFYLILKHFPIQKKIFFFIKTEGTKKIEFKIL